MCVLLDSFGASNSQCKRKSAITLIGIKTVTIDCNIGQLNGITALRMMRIHPQTLQIIADLKDMNPTNKAFEKALEDDEVIKLYIIIPKTIYYRVSSVFTY